MTVPTPPKLTGDVHTDMRGFVEWGFALYKALVIENQESTLLLDEDDMASNSDTKGATQQSIKYYVDALTSEENGYRQVNSAVTTNELDGTIEITANSFDITLRSAVGIKNKKCIIKNSGTGTVGVATTSSQTVDGASPSTIALTQNQYLIVQSNGSNWIIIGSS